MPQVAHLRHCKIRNFGHKTKTAPSLELGTVEIVAGSELWPPNSGYVRSRASIPANNRKTLDDEHNSRRGGVVFSEIVISVNVDDEELEAQSYDGA